MPYLRPTNSGCRRAAMERSWAIFAAHDALSREVENKDVLVHTIVHDLASPLNSILGSLSVLDERELPSDAPGLVRHALGAAMRQRSLIREILDVFAAEHGALESAPE